MASFEEATFNLIQSVSPSKHLSMQDVPYDSLKDLISECLGQKRKNDEEGSNGTARKIFKYDDETTPNSNRIFRRPSFCIGEDEDSRLSDSRLSAGPSDDSMTTNDEESRSSNLSWSKRKLHQSSSHTSGLKLNLSGFSLRQMKRVKRIQELREIRRKQATHEEFDEFAMDSEELSWSAFLSWWEGLYSGETQTLYLYHRVINSLRNYYSRHTWSTSVEEQVKKFLISKIPMLRRHIATTRDQISDGEPPHQVRNAELMVMMEMHILAINQKSSDEKSDPQKTKEDAQRFLKNMISDLRYIFTATNTRYLRSFLEETICDTFSHLIPRILAEIFDELCITMPPDLEEFAPNTGSNPPSGSNSPFKGDFHKTDSTHSVLTTEFPNSKNSTSKGNNPLDQLLEELQDAPSSKSDSSQHNTSTKNKKKHSIDEDNSLKSLKPVKRKIIPETPEKKLLKLQQKIEDDEEIQATPLAKMNRGKNDRKAQRLSEVVKKSEERLSRKPRAAAVASEKASRAIIQAVSTAEVAKTTKAAFLSLNRSSSRSTKARINLKPLFDD